MPARSRLSKRLSAILEAEDAANVEGFRERLREYERAAGKD
jgi:hypothetical protein